MTEYSETIPTKPGHYVYRLWTADGTCLYVGCVGERSPRKLRDRLSDHKREKPWWPQVARIDAASFAGPLEVIAEEPAQIAQLNPVHNKAHKPKPPPPPPPPKSAPRKRTWADRCARNPELRLKKRERDRLRVQMRPSGGARAAIAKRRPSPGQGDLFGGAA